MKKLMLWQLMTVLSVILLASVGLAEIWSWECENSIRKLRDSQQEVATRYSEFEYASSELEYAESNLQSNSDEVESARFMYDLCEPTAYDDCDFWRMSLNSAIDEYNTALEEYNYADESYEAALSDLQSSADDFSYEVSRFKRNCLD